MGLYMGSEASGFKNEICLNGLATRGGDGCGSWDDY